MIRNKHALSIWAISVGLFIVACNTHPQTTNEDKYALSDKFLPWQAMPELYPAVELQSVFDDSKTFVDCKPKSKPTSIESLYLKARHAEGFDLEAFVLDHFVLPEAPSPVARSNEHSKFRNRLDSLWSSLERAPNPIDTLPSTLLKLPHPYIVPGGRFREIYYWDSYFTMIGLGVSGKVDMIGHMLDNFAHLIDTYGFIPNGNRSYYLGRSQPPYYAAMINLYEQYAGAPSSLKYLASLRREYNWWMEGLDHISSDVPVYGRVVRLASGEVLNRYYDLYDSPRPESYKEDIHLAEGLGLHEKAALYRNLRAGAESGWDYSTRWFRDSTDFSTIRTTDVLPVDLNCLLYNIELTLAKLYLTTGDSTNANLFELKARKRASAIRKVFWNPDKGTFTDFGWKSGNVLDHLNPASCYPLYFNIATPEQAKTVVENVKKSLLYAGGVATSQIVSGQQWDAPNGWAPLQWVVIKGFEHYGYTAEADLIASRWLKLCEKVYNRTGKMMEKYNVMDTTLTAGGGEYPTQDGFGWTNGVALGLMEEGAIY